MGQRLSTDRLELRPRRVTDAGVLWQLWSERDPRVPQARRLDPQGRPTVQDLARRVADEQGLHAVTVRATGAVIGNCGLVVSEDDERPELAFELLREHHGNGYATEAGSAVVDSARDAGLLGLSARVREWNTASRRVLATLGFREVRRTVDREHGDSILTVLDLP